METPRQEGEVPFVLWPRGFVHPQNSISMDRWVDILETELIGRQLKMIRSLLYLSLRMIYTEP